ncbi:MAG TPA: ABC transporter permease [Bacteroidales bacterium]|nr:ABC transporter permease [Bacteroidales bacterium]
MLRNLILKELIEITTNSRSIFVLILCIVIIPFSLFISSKQYEREKEAYTEAKHIYEARSSGKSDANFIAEGYIPPSPLKIISEGLSESFPDKIMAYNNQTKELIKDYRIVNPVGSLFGKIDFLNISTVLLSLLVLVFVFNSIIGEKESGTLKLIISNPVPRWKIILSKIAGNYIVFFISFCLGILIGIVILLMTTSIPILSNKYIQSLLLIVLITSFFLFILFNLGIFLSIKSKNSGEAITSSLLFWVFITIIIPKVSPMIAQMIYPIESPSVVDKRISLKGDEINAEYNNSCKKLMHDILLDRGINEYNASPYSDDPNIKSAFDEYNQKLEGINQHLYDRQKREIGTIVKEYEDKKLTQVNISKSISRLSPVSCYTYLVTDLTNTGIGEISNLESNARQFVISSQNDYYKEVCRNYRQYHFEHGYYTGNGAIDMSKVKVPTLNEYIYPTFLSCLSANWIDIVIILFYTILFFALSVFSFIRYDVR